MSLPETGTVTLDSNTRQQLLKLSEASICHGFEHNSALQVDTDDYPSELQQERAVFVTLNRDGALRGCIGHLEAVQSLLQDVADNAYAAAFSDPRFPPLTTAELDGLELHISVLTPAQPMEFKSEQALLSQLQPGIDGLILQEGYHRGTFLPSVWEQLPEPADFLRQLKLKAGLPADHWSEKIQLYRYQTESFSGVITD